MLPDLFTTTSPTTSSVPMPVWLDLAAVFVGSISGLFYARERHLDLVGYIALAILCGLGGGLVRDTIMQTGDVYLLSSQGPIIVSITCGIVGFLFPRSLLRYPGLLEWVDIISVGLFAAAGADKALRYQLFPVPIVFMGTITGVGGGMMRDVFMGEVPRIFKRSNLYAICAVAGSLSYYLCVVFLHLHKAWAALVCVLVTLALRRLSLRFDIYSPADVDLEPAVRSATHRAAEAAREATKNEMQHALGQYERQQSMQLHSTGTPARDNARGAHRS